MNLKRLEMYGFKSFADKTVLDFKSGITTVIGPNGSGKSNISDCVRWVLGEQSIKALRGAKTEDIIFAGTQNRKSLGFAEASLVFDNSDGKLPIEYSEVTITRRIYRSGESGYFINKSPCRLKDVLELFMDTGIGKDGYSIIGQGKVDEILSNKSEDRRHIFEEAAGIVKYRSRKNESEKKLEQTKLNLLRINDIISEIESNIDSLRIQSEKAKKFLSLRDELKNIEVGLFLYNIDDYKKQIKEIADNLEIFETQKIKEEEKLNGISLERENLRESLESLVELIEKTQNLGFEVSQKKEQLNSDINVNLERIANNEENYKRYEIEINGLEEKNKILEEDKVKKITKKADLTLNKEKYEKELAQKREEYDKYAKTLSDKEIEIEAKKKIVDTNIDKKYELIATSNTEKANYENLLKREKSLKSELDSTILELDSIRAIKSEADSGFFVIQSSRNKVLKELEEVKNRTAKSNKVLNEFNEKINNLESEYRVKESRHKFLVETEREKEGYNKSVKSILQLAEKDNSFKKGMHGVLANLISVPKEYETAIEMALGASIQNIVTDTEDEAKRFVNYLRDNKLGRASFLPISSMKGQKLTKLNTTGINGVCGIASDLIKFDAKYEQIVLNLLGKTVIVDDMDSAIALGRKNSNTFKIVTLKGDIINSSGSITGGYVAPKTTNLLGRGLEIKTLEKELKTLSSKIEKIKQEKSEYELNIKSDFELLETKQKELNDSEIVFATENQKIENFKLEILKLEAKRDKIKDDIAINVVDQEASNQLKLAQEKEMADLEDENKTLSAEIENFTRIHKDTQKYIDDLKFDINNLEISVSSFDESELSINEFMDKLDEDIKSNNESIQNKIELREKILETNKDLQQKNIELNEQISQMEKDVANSQEKSKELKDERANKNEKIAILEKELSEKQNTVEDIKNQISKLEVKTSKIELELEQVINKMWEEYELTPNNVKDVEKVTNPKEVQKQVNDLRSQMKDIGSVNIDSIKEYQETKERYDFMCEQRLDLENSISKLKKLISEIVETMKNQFNEKFKLINKNFKETFSELFGGGKAELKLEDENNVLECGIEIEVQPPGKKLQNMLLLSGGERAFTAIALLFAILKINPAPFCVLDEIEAALDDVNVYRFAEYLKKFDKNTQFLVITHRKGTMEAADTVYGITMEEKGISKLLSINMNENI
jgi:chromosome segregation protein